MSEKAYHMSKEAYIEILNTLIKEEQDGLGYYNMVIDSLPTERGWKLVLQELNKIIKDEEEHIETLEYLIKNV